MVASCTTLRSISSGSCVAPVRVLIFGAGCAAQPFRAQPGVQLQGRAALPTAAHYILPIESFEHGESARNVCSLRVAELQTDHGDGAGLAVCLLEPGAVSSMPRCSPSVSASSASKHIGAGGRRASDSEESQRLRGHHLRLSTHHLRLSTPNRSAGYHAGILCHQPRAYRRGSVAITSRLSLRLHPPRAYRRGHNTAYLDAYPLRTAVSANMPTSSRINAASCLSPRPPISTPSTTPASSFGSSPTYIHAAMGDAAAVLRPTPRETPSSPHALEPPTRPMQHQIERCSAPRLVERSTTPRSPHVLEPYAAAAIGPIERMMLNSMRLLGMLLGTRLSARGVTPSPAASAEKHYRMMLRLEPLTPSSPQQQ